MWNIFRDGVWLYLTLIRLTVLIQIHYCVCKLWKASNSDISIEMKESGSCNFIFYRVCAELIRTVMRDVSTWEVSFHYFFCLYSRLPQPQLFKQHLRNLTDSVAISLYWGLTGWNQGVGGTPGLQEGWVSLLGSLSSRAGSEDTWQIREWSGHLDVFSCGWKEACLDCLENFAELLTEVVRNILVGGFYQT